MFSEIGDPAEVHWEIDRQSCGQVYRPYYVVLVRKKKTGKSVVKASSTDAVAVNDLINQLNNDLKELTNHEFVSKYELGSAA